MKSKSIYAMRWLSPEEKLVSQWRPEIHRSRRTQDTQQLKKPRICAMQLKPAQDRVKPSNIGC